MTRIIIATIIFSLSFNSYGQLAIEDSTSITNIIKYNIKKYIDNYKIPGSVMTLVHKGKLIYNQGTGYEDIVDDINVDPIHSQFRVASITKTFTALAILQMVDQRLLDLHTDISTYLPSEEFPIDAQFPITIHHLLTHSAGFEFSNVRVRKEAVETGTLESFVRTSINRQVFRPGEMFYYSNKGYGILGYLIERYSGLRYEDYIEEKVLRPLGMIHSTMYQHTTEHPIERPVTPYLWDNEYLSMQRLFVFNPAATTLNTTGYDMGLFMIGMMRNQDKDGKPIISSSSYELMMASQFELPIKMESMAYGMMKENYRGYEGYNHGGGIEGFGSYYTFYPELELGLFSSQSGGEDNTGYVFQTIYSTLDSIIGKKDYEYRPDVSISNEILELANKCEGYYQLTTVTKSTFERGRKLFGINEQRVRHIGKGQLEFNSHTYYPAGDYSFMTSKEDGQRELGFSFLGGEQPKYMFERLYWGFERIPWYKRAIVLQLATGLSILSIIYFTIISPLILRRRSLYVEDKIEKIIRWACWFLLIGFVIVLVAYGLDVDITHGVPFIYKIGFALITISTLGLLLSPITFWRSLTDSELTINSKIIASIYTASIVILLISFWSMNLIGFNY